MDRDAYVARGEALVERGRQAKVGRNDACWCGSGRKYKRCHAPHDHRASTLPPLSDRIEDVVRELLGDDDWRVEDARKIRVALDLAGIAWNLSRIPERDRGPARLKLLGNLAGSLRDAGPAVIDALVARALDYPDDPRTVIKVDLVDGPTGWEIRTASAMTASQARRYQR